MMAIVERKNIGVIVRMTGRELNYSLKKRIHMKRSGIVLQYIYPAPTKVYRRQDFTSFNGGHSPNQRPKVKLL